MSVIGDLATCETDQCTDTETETEREAEPSWSPVVSLRRQDDTLESRRGGERHASDPLPPLGSGAQAGIHAEMTGGERW